MHYRRPPIETATFVEAGKRVAYRLIEIELRRRKRAFNAEARPLLEELASRLEEAGLGALAGFVRGAAIVASMNGKLKEVWGLTHMPRAVNTGPQKGRSNGRRH